MSPTLSKAFKRSGWVTAALIGVFVLYALSLRPVLWLFDTENAPAGYNNLPGVVRFFYYPLQHIPWPTMYQGYLRAGYRADQKPYVPTEAERAAWPETIDEAVTRILADMKDADKKQVREAKKEDLILFHHDWGMGIRNELGLWRGNTNLMTDCQARHPDDASMVIIEAVWQRLQKP